MPKPLYLTSSLVIIFFFYNSCSSYKPIAQINIHPEWIEIQLPANWSIRAPKGFKIKRAIGDDSYVGRILSESDSVVAEYDCGYFFSSYVKKRSFSRTLRDKKAAINDDEFKYQYGIPKYNIAFVETIDGLVAWIVKPNNMGKNITEISINDAPKNWLGITSDEHISSKNESILLDMFKTIKLKRK